MNSVNRCIVACIVTLGLSTVVGAQTLSVTTTPSATSAAPTTAIAVTASPTIEPIRITVTPSATLATASVTATPSVAISTPSITVSTPSIAVATPSVTTAAVVTSPSVAPSDTVTVVATTPNEEIVVPVPEPPSLEELYVYLDEEAYKYPLKPRKQYPDISVDGFYEANYSGRDYSPKIGSGPNDISPTDNRWDAIRNDPVFNKLPRDVLLGEPQLNIRYQFNIDGQLDEDLSVHYDVEQEPDFPGRFDIWVERKEDKLTFFQFDADFQNGEFINVKKALNGAKYEHNGEDWEAIIATGKQRSTPKKFEGFGSGRAKIKVGTRNLLFGSVKVWVNNQLQAENQNYEVNYFEGEITFLTSTPGPADFIEVIYEFTNPIEDFIPVLNRKNFFGAQYKWRSKPIVRKEKQRVSITQETIRTSKDAGTVQGPAVFFLEHSPIVLGTDVVELNGMVLTRGKDYFLKHHTGRIKFFNLELTHEDTITVDYDYFVTEKVTEDIIGKDIPGPYKLEKDHLLDGSAVLSLDGRELREAYDYIIDYDVGEIYMNYVVKYPQIISVEYEAIKTTINESQSNKRPLRLGVTYMNENVKGDESNIIKRITSENVTVTDNVLTVSSTPIVNTANIKITVNGSAVATSNYTILNTYLGTIELASILDATSAVISYDQQENFRSNFSFTVEATEQTFINNQTPGFRLADLPVQKGGISHILLFRNGLTLRLEEDKDFTVDYGTDGNSIAITFLLASDPGGQNSDLIVQGNQYPQAGELMTVFYDYTTDSPPNGGNIEQELIGITVGADLSKKWSIATEIAAANNNFSKPQIDESKTFFGTGVAGASYDLGRRNIVENSESVFIRKDALSSVRLNKDDDYIINYVTGRVIFVNLNPSTSDEITLDYKYFDTSNTGTTEAGEEQSYKMAAKFSAQYRDEKVKANTHYKVIDRDFVPFSPIQERRGITQFGGNLDWSFNEADNINMKYEKESQLIGKRNDNQDQFQNTDDFSFGATLKLFEVFDTTHSGRYLSIIQDPADATATTNKHPIDDLTLKYDTSIAVGPGYFRQRLSGGITKKFTDYLDKFTPGVNTDVSYTYGSDIKITGLALLKEVDLYPTYTLRNINNTVDVIDTATTGNPIVTQITKSRQRTQGITSQIRPSKKLTADLSYQTSDKETISPGQNTTEKNKIINEQYGLDYRPFSWLLLGYNHRRNESESPLFNQSANVETLTDHRIRRFSPHDMLTHFGHNPDRFYVSMIRGSHMDFSNSEKRRQRNNDLDKFSFSSHSIGYYNFRPIQGLNLSRLKYDTRVSETLNLADTATSQNVSESKFSALGSKLTYRPKKRYLRMFKYDLGLDTKKDTQISNRINTNTTSNIITTTRPTFHRTQTLTFDPGRVKWNLWKLPVNLGQTHFSVNESWNDSVDRRLQTQIPSDSAKDTVETLSQNNSLVRSYTYISRLRPYNRIDFTGTYKDLDEEYSRNQTLSNQGQTIRNTDQIDTSAGFAPFSFLSFEGSAGYKTFDDFKSPSLNASFSQIKQGRITNDADVFTSFIARRDYYYGLQATLTPIHWFSVRGKGNVAQRRETNDTLTDTTFNIFDQITGTTGLILRPISGLEISYDYGITRTEQNKTNGRISYSGNTRVKYAPFQRKNFKVNILFTRTDNWGQSFNSLDEARTQQGTGDVIATVIEKIDTTVQQGTLSIDINIPLDQSPYVERLVISGEGHLKQVIDRLDDTKVNKNSYEISGLILKGTLMF